MISKNYDPRSQATQTWFLLKFYENSVFLTTRSAICTSFFKLFFAGNYFRVLPIYLKMEFLQRIGAECTLGCEKYQILIKFWQEPCLSSLRSSIIIFRYRYFTYRSSNYFSF